MSSHFIFCRHAKISPLPSLIGVGHESLKKALVADIEDKISNLSESLMGSMTGCPQLALC